MIREHRRCLEYSEIVPKGRVDETGQFADRIQRGSTQVRWFGQDLSRAPDSGIGYTLDYRTQWANGDWVEPNSYRPTGAHLMGRKRRAGDRLVHFETGSNRAPKPTDGKRRLIRGEGLVARNDYEPQLPVVGEDIPGPAVMNYLGVVQSLETVDQRATVIGHGFLLPCSDSDESDDDVLLVGPMQPLVTAAPLGGARRNDDGMIQINSLSDEWSVDSWTAENRHGTCCAQLDDFDWVCAVG